MAENDQQVATSAEQGDSNETAVVQEQQNVEANVQQEPAENRLGFFNVAKTLMVRCIFIYMITSFFRRPSTTTPPPGQAVAPGSSAPAMGPAQNIYVKDMTLDMYVYVTEQEIFTDFNDEKSLYWLEEELGYGDWMSGANGDGTYERKGELSVSEAVQNNGSLYIHVYFVRAGNSPNPNAETFEKKTTIHQWRILNRYKKRHYHSSTNLLTGQTNAHPDMIKKANETKMEILSFWHPNLTVNLVEDYTPWMPGAVPAPINDFVKFVDGGMHYSPILFLNDYWNLNAEMTPINDTTPVLNFTLTYSPMSLFKWQMYAAQTMRTKWYSSFLGDDFMEESDEDQDSLKTTFLETSPYLLGLTIVISIVHSIFEFLAFKNDIQFWRNRKSLEGLSVRSVIFGVIQSLIVVFYVMDNETNFVVRCSVCVGLAIEVWKIFKVIDITIDREDKLFGVIPRVVFKDKSTYVESATREYDREAFKYLSWVLYPLLVCYAIYSMLYLEHKGWYSFVLSLLYGFLLTFGFIMMTPQLFINYKLKSVAHLPWRMLTYKALNTFIDDLFAFVIKMPTLYRIGCLRDDVIFLIYLYQRYIYRVDPKRYNEFGTSQDMIDEPANGELPPGDKTPAIEGATDENKKENTDQKKKEKNSPKGEKGEKNSPKGEQNSPKGEKNSPKGEKNSPKGEKNSPKGEKNSPKGEKNSPKGEKNTPKSPPKPKNKQAKKED